MEGTPVLTFDTHLTAVAATSTGDYTVVFVGTNEGHLKKVSALYSLSPSIEEEQEARKRACILSLSLFSPTLSLARCVFDLIFNAISQRVDSLHRTRIFSSFSLSLLLDYVCVLFFPGSLVFLARMPRFVNPFSMRRVAIITA